MHEVSADLQRWGARRKKSTPQKKGTKKHFQTANKQFTSMMYSRGKNRQEMIRYKSGQRVLRITDKQRENETLSVRAKTLAATAFTAGIIYIMFSHTSPLIYVGQTGMSGTTLQERTAQHVYQAKVAEYYIQSGPEKYYAHYKDAPEASPLENLMAKTGPTNWAVRILEAVARPDGFTDNQYSSLLEERENYWQWVFRAYRHQFGLCRAGQKGMGKYSPNRKRIKIASIDKISRMAAEGGRRWKRGKQGQNSSSDIDQHS